MRVASGIVFVATTVLACASCAGRVPAPPNVATAPVIATKDDWRDRLAAVGGAADIRKPSLDEIDYAHPEKYLALAPPLADPRPLAALASPLKGESDRKSVERIARWFDGTIRIGEEARLNRNAQEIASDRFVTGCAEHSILFGSLARAVGIPTVWVKTMDVDWIREYAAAPGSIRDTRGHVFLEMFLDGKWRLVDPVQKIVYDDYDPRLRILPGNRLAYDKGSDPFALPLSSMGERWTHQTLAYFAGYDVSALPVGRGASLTTDADASALPGPVFIAGDNPYVGRLSRRLESQGVKVAATFNHNFEELLPRAAGHTLIVVVAAGKLVLPEPMWPSVTAVSLETLRSRGRLGVLGRRRSDGTNVFVVYGSDDAEVNRMIDAFPPALPRRP